MQRSSTWEKGCKSPKSSASPKPCSSFPFACRAGATRVAQPPALAHAYEAGCEVPGASRLACAWVCPPNRGRSDPISRGERETGPALIADRPRGHPRESPQRVQARPAPSPVPRKKKCYCQPVSSNPGHFQEEFSPSPVFLRIRVLGTTSGEWEGLPPHHTENIPEPRLTGVGEDGIAPCSPSVSRAFLASTPF